MSTSTTDLESAVLATLVSGVAGGNAHLDSSTVLDGLDWTLAGKELAGSPYTILECANHIIFWNGYAIAAMAGTNPKAPEHAVDGWPGPKAPASEEEWRAFVAAYKANLAELTENVKQKRFTETIITRLRIDSMRSMIQHISYHVGQIALLRRMMGAWPPPTGGDTW
jgi:uncharacterized damage-inducible protein DinB